MILFLMRVLNMFIKRWFLRPMTARLLRLYQEISIAVTFKFEEDRGPTLIVKEPIGVCGFITPWNWPLNQIVCKVAPAIATGCTMVLKPSEVAPFSGHIFAEIMHAAGVPAGVFNMVQGDGIGVGVPLSSHPEVDMVSFTGSTRAGIEVAKNAAPTVKRVAQELGGKSPNIVLDDGAFAKGVGRGVATMMTNSGQSCNAPTRMLVPKGRMDEAITVAREAASQVTVGDPNGNSQLGPVVSEVQFNKIQKLIQAGIDEGATLVIGGVGRPDGLDKGYYVKPTVFANVTSEMTIAKEEIFGPVLSILGYESVEQAIDIGNDTEYGLAAYVFAQDINRAFKVIDGLETGMIGFNQGMVSNAGAPFGGVKQSGFGREGGPEGLHEYLSTKYVALNVGQA